LLPEIIFPLDKGINNMFQLNQLKLEMIQQVSLNKNREVFE